MNERMAPTVITGQRQFGWLLLMLRTLAGWSHRKSGATYGCAPALVGLRERGLRALNVQQAVDVIGQHGYVLVMMHGDQASLLHRVQPQTFEAPPHADDLAARPVG